MSEPTKFDMELKLRNEIADLEIRNTTLLTEIKAVREEVNKRFTDEQIVRIFYLNKRMNPQDCDYF